MKLGISYNLFDGYELLESSITVMRPMVDHISVVFQETSNNGKNKIDRALVMSLLNRLVSKNLVDTVIEFTPNTSKSPHNNEVDKRQVGYNKAREVGCSHYMSMDVDEFYFDNEFNNTKKIIDDGNYDGSIIEYVNYYGDFAHQIPMSHNQYVPFIYKINGARRFQLGNALSNTIVCDPTRQIQSNQVIKFESNNILMHHMSYVRDKNGGMRRKLENSSARVNWGHDPEAIEEMVKYYENWTSGDDGMRIVNINRGNKVVGNATERYPLHCGVPMFKYIESPELSTIKEDK
jgi:hypothetical protein